MITKMYQSIADGLKAVKPCPIYMEDVPQGFKQPSFLISFYQVDNFRGINGRMKNTVGVDAMYFPADGPEKAAECLAVGQDLARGFKSQGFKAKNRNQKIEDNVLHFMFEIEYWEYPESDTVQMRGLTTNMNIKEV